MDMSVDDMLKALAMSDLEMPTPPARWGDKRNHVFYGSFYHWFGIFRNRDYLNFARHRELPIAIETWPYTKRLLLMPDIALDRHITTMRIHYGDVPYHLVLLQLAHDASFQKHSLFTRMEEFLTVVMDGFAKGTPRHHHLGFKAHPLDSDRSQTKRIVKRLAAQAGVSVRVHYICGGKMARVLYYARTAVTVNSTPAHHVLWRGIRLKVSGNAAYNKTEFVSDQALADSFTNFDQPNSRAYGDCRRFLLETSQVPVGLYSACGRRQLMREFIDMVLSDADPYDSLAFGKTPPHQPLRIIN
jgi:capsular polysaccharide export protein